MGTRRKNQKGGGAWSLPTSSGKIKKIPDGKMKNILDGKMEINTTDEKYLLRYTQLDETTKLKYYTRNLQQDLEYDFENMLKKTSSEHKQMANEPLKTALSNIRQMLYKMEIMFIDKKLPGNLEDLEERLIKSFVTLSQKVSPATDASKPPPPPASKPPPPPAAPASLSTTANPVVPPDTTANPSASALSANPAASDDDAAASSPAAAALSDSAASAPAAAAKPIVAPAAAALSETKPIVDPADDGPTGEAARHKSDEVRHAEKVIKAKAAEDAAEKAEKAARNAVLASPGAVETKDGK